MKANWRIAVCAALAMSAGMVALHEGAQARNVSDALSAGARAPKTVEVKMTNEGGTVRFDPKEITIVVGDTVKWVAAGGNHNIKFWPDSVPAGALAPLKAAMKDTGDSLTTPRYPTLGTGYTMVFAGVPKGVYKYHCGPHLMRGMTATITVQ